MKTSFIARIIDIRVEDNGPQPPPVLYFSTRVYLLEIRDPNGESKEAFTLPTHLFRNYEELKGTPHGCFPIGSIIHFSLHNDIHSGVGWAELVRTQKLFVQAMLSRIFEGHDRITEGNIATALHDLKHLAQRCDVDDGQFDEYADDWVKADPRVVFAARTPECFAPPTPYMEKLEGFFIETWLDHELQYASDPKRALEKLIAESKIAGINPERFERHVREYCAKYDRAFETPALLPRPSKY
jgi:hypothetical protein